MIFRHFDDEQGGGHAYLVAAGTGGEATIVNPSLGTLEACRTALATLGLRLACTLRTERNGRCAKAADALAVSTGARRIAPLGAAGHGDASDAVVPGASLDLGGLRVDVVAVPPGYAGNVAYRVSYYTFAGHSVLIDFREGPLPPDGEPEALLDQARPLSAPAAPAPRSTPIENFRRSREGVCVERLILEDLHTSLAESRFTPKEARVVETYVRLMEENGFAPPSAAALAARLGDVDRTAVHVLVHNVRWKQIDLSRLPLVLAGQTSKWLRGLQTEPEFTAHERAFLQAYLELVRRHGRPPTGPEVAVELGGHRSVQWIRKRAHTIRRKQREFDMPELLLARKRPAPVPGAAEPASSEREPGRPAERPSVRPDGFGARCEA